MVGNRRFVRRITCATVSSATVILRMWLESLLETAMIVLMVFSLRPRVR